MSKKVFSNDLGAHSSSLLAWVNTTLHEQLLSSFGVLVPIFGIQARAGDRDAVRLSLRLTPGKGA